MINVLSILISTVMVMYVVVRAARMDRVRPWFETRSLYEQERKRGAAAAGEAAKQRMVFGRQPRLPAELFTNRPAARR